MLNKHAFLVSFKYRPNSALRVLVWTIRALKTRKTCNLWHWHHALPKALCEQINTILSHIFYHSP